MVVGGMGVVRAGAVSVLCVLGTCVSWSTFTLLLAAGYWFSAHAAAVLQLLRSPNALHLARPAQATWQQHASLLMVPAAPPCRAGVAVQGKDDKARLMSQLRLLLRCVTLLGLLVAAFGPAYSYTLLRLMYGPRWSDTDAPQVLGYYCGYVLVLAVNGEGLGTWLSPALLLLLLDAAEVLQGCCVVAKGGRLEVIAWLAAY